MLGDTLREAREKLLEGADFEALSREISDKPAEQTDLGYFKQGETMPEIEALTFSMRVGEISPVVATHFGFHIFKVTERKAPEAIPFETVRESVGERFVAERREKAIEALLDAIKAKTTIEEREEAADHA